MISPSALVRETLRLLPENLTFMLAPVVGVVDDLSYFVDGELARFERIFEVDEEVLGGLCELSAQGGEQVMIANQDKFHVVLLLLEFGGVELPDMAGVVLPGLDVSEGVACDCRETATHEPCCRGGHRPAERSVVQQKSDSADAEIQCQRVSQKGERRLCFELNPE